MKELFFGEGIGHTIMLFGFVIAIGIYLGRFKFKGISLGSTWILFVGIFLSHFGLRANPELLHFLKEFGLILFVFSIGLSVGPGFFHSFKSGGLKLNMLAVGMVLLAVLTTYIIHLVTGESLTTMVGVMSGAVTNTPGLGAAQQTLSDAGTGIRADTLASGYAVAYPLGVLGVILTLILVKAIFKIDLKKEEEALGSKDTAAKDTAMRFVFEVKNPALFNRTLSQVDEFAKKCVISRVRKKDGDMIIPGAELILEEGDQLMVVTSKSNEEAVRLLFGNEVEFDKKVWSKFDATMVNKNFLITKSELVGKTLGELNIRSTYGVSITRVRRAGIDLIASPDIILQLGDSLRVVGPETSVNKLKGVLGDSQSGLNHPYLMPIFFGIALGVILGSIPIKFPGIPQAIKLGLAGGPLIVAILISYFGPKLKITTYTTTSANLMVREIGISIFLAAVGIGAGENFVSSITGGGYWWILYGALITIIPTFVTAVIGRVVFKLNFYQLTGLITGGCTNPPVLAFAQNMYGTNYTSVNYATVYPLSMFMRVFVAQVLILVALA